MVFENIGLFVLPLGNDERDIDNLRYQILYILQMKQNNLAKIQMQLYCL